MEKMNLKKLFQDNENEIKSLKNVNKSTKIINFWWNDETFIFLTHCPDKGTNQYEINIADVINKQTEKNNYFTVDGVVNDLLTNDISMVLRTFPASIKNEGLKKQLVSFIIKKYRLSEKENPYCDKAVEIANMSYNKVINSIKVSYK